MKKNLIGAIILVIAGAGLIWAGLAAQSYEAELAKGGITVPGRIVDGDVHRRRKNRKSYRISVDWAETTGAAHAAQVFSVKKAFFQQHISGEDAVLKSEVTVRYLPGRASEAIIVGGSSSLSGIQYLGLALLAFGGWWAVRSFTAR